MTRGPAKRPASVRALRAEVRALSAEVTRLRKIADHVTLAERDRAICRYYKWESEMQMRGDR